jgi:uncharacterized membrane protein
MISPPRTPRLAFNDSAIAYGGIYVMVVTIIAMVMYIAIMPVWETLYPLMVVLDAKSPNLVMQARIDTSYDLFLILPVISIGIAVIFFTMRTIRRQAYSAEYEENEFR